MTSELDDFDDLKRAMEAATPSADASRRAENIAQARANFAALHNPNTTAKQRFSWGVLRRSWAGMATGATALVAVAVLVVPTQDEVAPPVPASLAAPTAEIAVSSMPQCVETSLAVIDAKGNGFPKGWRHRNK